jgi:hypothetical protein
VWNAEARHAGASFTKAAPRQADGQTEALAPLGHALSYRAAARPGMTVIGGIRLAAPFKRPCPFENLDLRCPAPSCSKAFRADDFPIAGAATLASAAFSRGLLDGQAAITAANKAAKSTMIARTSTKCAILNGPGNGVEGIRASNQMRHSLILLFLGWGAGNPTWGAKTELS